MDGRGGGGGCPSSRQREKPLRPIGDVAAVSSRRFPLRPQFDEACLRLSLMSREMVALFSPGTEKRSRKEAGSVLSVDAPQGGMKATGQR